MRKRILIIEDNEYSLYMLTFILTRHGYEVIQARDGRDGIALASQVEPALILLDIQLPVVDGYTVAQTLRRTPGLAQLPIIAVTSYAMVGDREQILAAGCTDYIEKPIDPDTFMAQIEAHLSAWRSEKEGAS
jgi:two-component system cell cycle response regulator DivK